MKRLRNFLGLTYSDRRLLVSTAILLGTVRLGLWLLPFQTLRRLLTRVAEASTRVQPPDVSSVERIVWAVAVASRYVPKATCLTQALAAEVLLEREGFPARLHIGVARNEEDGVQAHVWVESQGKIVVGGSRLGQYTPLLTLEKGHECHCRDIRP